MRSFLSTIVVLLTVLTATAQDVVTINLEPMSPDSVRSVRWSPPGHRFDLVSVSDGLETDVTLAGQLFRFRLEKSSPEVISYDVLKADLNADGQISDDEIQTTTPDSVRGRVWSSFSDFAFSLEQTHPVTGQLIRVPYPVAAWYVFDPFEPDTDPVLRFSRRGWTEGTTTLDGVPAVILLAESNFDGTFDRDDSWSLATADSAENVYSHTSNKGTNRHNWLGESAYSITEIHPSGLQMTVKRVNPGISRAEELRREDNLAADRQAPRSGKSVTFYHDYEEAKTASREQGKPLLVDFETVWCGPCKQMDQWVYTADEIVALAESVIALKLDGDDERELNEFFAVAGYPTIILLTPDGEELRRGVGYYGVAEMAAFLKGEPVPGE